MFDRSIRRVKDQWLHPLVVLFGDTSPHVVSITACVIGLASAWLAWMQCYEWAIPLWLLNRLFDGLDGAIAREQDKQTDFGGYVDILLDFVVYAAVPLGVAFSTTNVTHHVALGILLSVYYLNAASWMYLSALLEKRQHGVFMTKEQTSITMPATLIGGTETVVAYVLFLLLPGYFGWLAGLFSILIVFGILQRLNWARRHLNS